MFEELIQHFLVSYGSLGLIFVMVLQTIVAIIPSEAVVFFAGMLGMEFWKILIFGGIGLLLGAIIAFWLARIGREMIIEKLLGKKWLGSIDWWVDKHGGKAILIARLVPVIPFDLISYVSGVTSIDFRTYFVATLIGCFPRVAFLAYAGRFANSTLVKMGFTFEKIVALVIIGFILLLVLERVGFIDKIRAFIVQTLRKINKRKREE